MPTESGPGASAGTGPAALENHEVEGEAPEGENPDSEDPVGPGTVSPPPFFIIVPLSPLMLRASNVAAERSLCHMPTEAQELLTQFLRAPLSDEDKREFLTRWTTWRDGHMAVADRIGE